MNIRWPAHRSSAGFTLVETMVAILIGMLVTYIVMQVYATSEGQKRTITYGADAQSDAAVALYLIERDLRQAGYGLSANPEDFTPAFTPSPGAAPTSGVLAQCTTVTTYNASRGTIAYPNSTFAPVVINPKVAGGGNFIPPGDADTDVILINYGASQGMVGKGIQLVNENGATTQTGGNTPDYVVDSISGSRFGFQQGDLILAVPPGVTVGTCNIAEVTGLPGGTGTACTVAGADLNQVFVNHNAVQYPSYYTGCDPGNLTTATWNPGGVDTAFNAGSKLYNLGPAGSFVSRVYAVRNGNLTVCDLTVKDCTAAAAANPPDPTIWVPMANGAQGLMAQYGRDTNYDGAIDFWDQTTQTGANLAQIAAVRLALAVRSGQYEKPPFTSAAPVWHADALNTADANFVTTGWSTDWQQYRYKTAQSVIPVRNMIWGEQIN